MGLLVKKPHKSDPRDRGQRVCVDPARLLSLAKPRPTQSAVRGYITSDPEKYFDIHTNRLTDGWEIFYRIPLKFIRLFYPDYQFKGELAANFYKCGDETANKHYLSWSPIDLRSPDFHRPEYFGVITFEEKP
jgi:hypothetical protein